VVDRKPAEEIRVARPTTPRPADSGEQVPQVEPLGDPSMSVRSLRRLQQAAGNAAVGRMLQGRRHGRSDPLATTALSRLPAGRDLAHIGPSGPLDLLSSAPVSIQGQWETNLQRSFNDWQLGPAGGFAPIGSQPGYDPAAGAPGLAPGGPATLLNNGQVPLGGGPLGKGGGQPQGGAMGKGGGQPQGGAPGKGGDPAGGASAKGGGQPQGGAPGKGSSQTPGGKGATPTDLGAGGSTTPLGPVSQGDAGGAGLDGAGAVSAGADAAGAGGADMTGAGADSGAAGGGQAGGAQAGADQVDDDQ